MSAAKVNRSLKIAAILSVAAVPAGAAFLLVPMDETQADHLRAYGICYEALAAGARAEWLLNYRGGSFLIADFEGLAELCVERGVSAQYVADPGPIYNVVETHNMEAVPLTKAPRVALYAPNNEDLWDDAVMLALEYAEIPYEVVWDKEVLAGGGGNGLVRSCSRLPWVTRQAAGAPVIRRRQRKLPKHRSLSTRKWCRKRRSLRRSARFE